MWGVARDAGGLAETGTRCTPPGFFRSWVVDVADRASVHRWKDEVQAGGFDPDCVVLNASILQEDMAEGLDAESAARVLAVNLQGALWCVEAFLPGFLARHRGTFVVISSTSALRPSRRSASYTASKAGVISMTQGMAQELAIHSIRVNAIAPGAVETPMWDAVKVAYGQDQAADAPTVEASLLAVTPLGRLCRPEDCADAILYLCTDQSAFITGQTLNVDGGMYFN